MKQMTLFPYMKEVYMEEAQERIESIWDVVEPLLTDAYYEQLMHFTLTEQALLDLTLTAQYALGEDGNPFIGIVDEKSLAETKSRVMESDIKRRGHHLIYMKKYSESMKNLLLEPGYFLTVNMPRADPLFAENEKDAEHVRNHKLISNELFGRFVNEDHEAPTLPLFGRVTNYTFTLQNKKMSGLGLFAHLSMIPMHYQLAAETNQYAPFTTVKKQLLNLMRDAGWVQDVERYYSLGEPEHHEVSEKRPVKPELVEVPVRASWTLDAYNNWSNKRIRLLAATALSLERRIDALDSFEVKSTAKRATKTVGGSLNYIKKKTGIDYSESISAGKIKTGINVLLIHSKLYDSIPEVREHLDSLLVDYERVQKIVNLQSDLKDSLAEANKVLAPFRVPRRIHLKEALANSGRLPTQGSSDIQYRSGQRDLDNYLLVSAVA